MSTGFHLPSSGSSSSMEDKVDLLLKEILLAPDCNISHADDVDSSPAAEADQYLGKLDNTIQPGTSQSESSTEIDFNISFNNLHNASAQQLFQPDDHQVDLLNDLHNLQPNNPYHQPGNLWDDDYNLYGSQNSQSHLHKSLSSYELNASLGYLIGDPTLLPAADNSNLYRDSLSLRNNDQEQDGLFDHGKRFRTTKFINENPQASTGTSQSSPTLISKRDQQHIFGGSTNYNQKVNPYNGKVCTLCGSTKTPAWRRHPYDSTLVCNACGLYLKLHNKPREMKIVNGVVKTKRNKKPAPKRTLN
ncbi:hypothetical protein MIR68_008604 [Amoeboaphelidium protococcarum]|nr:hypothetical protein MIR68_008604 [Amoeboaphelidium protococcarum]